MINKSDALEPKPQLSFQPTDKPAQSFTMQPRKAPVVPKEDTPEGWYSVWKQSQDPDAGAGLLKSMHESLRAATRKYAGSDDPITLGHARSLFVKALPRYDGRSSLETFADRQLQPLIRWKARKEIAVRVPTLKARKLRQIQQAEDELEGELGRSPSHDELADHTGIPVKLIGQLQRMKYPVLSDQWQGTGEDQVQAGDQGVEDNNQMAVRVVYHSLTGPDQIILQHSLGLYDAPVLSNEAIAKKLRISPGAVSQRRTRIQAMLDEQQRYEDRG